MSRLTSALTGAVRSVNRTDAATLSAARVSLAEMLRSTPEQLSACPGIGPTKVGGREGDAPRCITCSPLIMGDKNVLVELPTLSVGRFSVGRHPE